MSYTAFISYSHATDGQLAPAVQSALHRFAKPWYRLRALRVFRDRTDLAANPGLWSAIEKALAESEFFLYMASPEAARSKWVSKELEFWITHKPPQKILILLTHGELNWNGNALDFDWSRTTAVPTLLSGQFREEPFFVDLRWAQDAANLSLRHSQFRQNILDLAAPLHGRPVAGTILCELPNRKPRALAARGCCFRLPEKAVSYSSRCEFEYCPC